MISLPEQGDVRPPAIRCTALIRRFGATVAVAGIDLDVPTGSIYGLIGQNGAGKTTTLAMLAALLEPSEGSLEVCGHDPVRQPREVARRIGYMPDVLGFYDRLTVREYLEFYASAYGIGPKHRPARVDGLLQLVELTALRDAQVDSLSRGMKQRLSLARALVHDPELLLLDEPASGLDPRARVDLRDLLLELRSLGKTIVVSSHILSELEQLCTDVAIIHRGRLVLSGPLPTVLGSTRRSRRVRVRLAGGLEELHDVADEADQQSLLRRLVGEGRPVLEFREEEGLQELYLSLTDEASDDPNAHN